MNFIQCNNHSIQYEWQDNGHKESLLFINALGSNLRIWDEVAAILSPEFNLLRFNKRGHGFSSIKSNPTYMSDYAADALCLLDTLQIPEVNVIGLSIGGMIAMALYDAAPNRISKLVFSCTGAKLGEAEAWNERIATVRQHGMSAIAAATIQRWISPSYYEAHPTLMEGYTNMVDRVHPEGYAQACIALREADYRQLLPNIIIPSLFIAGSLDAGTRPELVQNNAAQVPKAEYREIEGVGHIPCIDKPDLMSTLIKDFIQKT